MYYETVSISIACTGFAGARGFPQRAFSMLDWESIPTSAGCARKIVRFSATRLQFAQNPQILSDRLAHSCVSRVLPINYR
jgi:hypothetical protein